MKDTVIISLMAILIFALPALGDETKEMSEMQPPPEGDNLLTAKKWYNGPYFLAGIGPSESMSITNNVTSWSYAGCHLLVNLGYWAYDAFGIELGGFINYSYFENLTVYDYTGLLPTIFESNKIKGIDAHLWDSSFYLSVMIRCPFIKRTDLFNAYLKLMIGYGVSVYWVKDIPKSFLMKILTAGDSTIADLLNGMLVYGWKGRSDRFNSDGPVFGVSIGNIFNAFNDKTVWFLQLTALAKMYREVIAVMDGKVIPTKLANFNKINNNHIIQLYLTAGIRLF